MLNPPVIAHKGTSSFAALLPNPPITEVGAAYPFPNADYPRCYGPDTSSATVQTLYPNGKYVRYATTSSPTNPTSTTGTGDNISDPIINPCRTDQPVFGEKSLFGLGELPPPAQLAISFSDGGNIPMLPGMMRNYPNFSNRGLWFRSTWRWNWITGASNTAGFGWGSNRALYLYSHSHPQVVSENANPNHPGRLVLPETVCINIDTGAVDATCSQDNETGPVPANLAQLNFPRNPNFPLNKNGINPASAFAVCGATGRSMKYQSTQALLNGTLQRDLTDGYCDNWAGNPREAIRTFLTRLTDPRLDPSPGGTFSNFRGLVPRVIALDDKSVAPGKVGTDIINVSNGELTTSTVGLNQIRNGELPINVDDLTETANRDGFDVVIEARNTYADNRVHVLNLCSVFAGDSSVDVPCPTVNGITARVLTGTITFRANPNEPAPSPVFILKGSPNEDLIFKGLKIKLEGVEPNNIFWVVPRTTPTTPSNAPARGLTIASIVDNPGTPEKPSPAYDPIPSIVVGNFIGIMPDWTATKNTGTTLNISRDVAIRGARFLGFRSVPAETISSATEGILGTPERPELGAIGVASSTLVVAVTTVNQPITVPVNQFHVPTFTDSINNDNLNANNVRFPNRFDGDAINGDPDLNGGKNAQWTQRALTAEVNAYFVVGTTPSRSYVTLPNLLGAGITTGETAGGLPNWIRFIDNWAGITEKTSGGFMQNTRSRFATAPFSATGPYADLSDLNYSSYIDTLYIDPNQPNSPLSTYDSSDSLGGRVYNSLTSQAIPFYTPPRRLWGFDVGLLVQTPDRFAERFSRDLPTFNDFFREVDKTDRWVQALLCAAQPADPNADNPTTGNGEVNLGAKQRLGTRPNRYTVRALFGLSEMSEAQCNANRHIITSYN